MEEKQLIKYLFTVIIFVSTILNASEINNFILKDSVEKSLMSISFELDNISLDEKSGYTIINSHLI